MSAKFASGEVPQQFATVMTLFLNEYAESNLQAEETPEAFQNNIFTFLKTIQHAMKEPYQFNAFHEAIREPFDYYNW